jgi:hypothetical protein
MAQQQSIPGVFAYLSEGGPRLAESFTSGMNAGSRVKAQQSEDARTKADQEYRSQRDTYNRGRDTTEDQFKRDAIARQDEINKQGLMQRYGQDIKYDASGGVDLQSSEMALKQRASDAEVAAAMGEISGMGMGGAIDDSIRQNPKFMVGAAKGGGRKLMLDELGMRQQAAFDQQTLMQDERANLELEKFMEEQAQMASGPEADIREVNGVPMYFNNGKGVPLSGGGLELWKRQNKKPAATNSPPMIRVTRDPQTGAPVIVRP